MPQTEYGDILRPQPAAWWKAGEVVQKSAVARVLNSHVDGYVDELEESPANKFDPVAMTSVREL